MKILCLSGDNVGGSRRICERAAARRTDCRESYKRRGREENVAFSDMKTERTRSLYTCFLIKRPAYRSNMPIVKVAELCNVGAIPVGVIWFYSLSVVPGLI